MHGSFSIDALADLLSAAYIDNSVATVPPALEPVDIDGAYEVQQRILKKCNVGTGGWKIGAKSETGPIQGAPLPLSRIYSRATPISRRDYPILGIELEITFSFDRDFLPRPDPIAERDVLESISAFGASIEVVSSRVAGWPETPKLVQLADLQNNGALIVGKMVEYRSEFSFINPMADLRINGVPVFTGLSQNPAGDPRRLLCWLVNHCSKQGLVLPAGSIITTGSYTGMVFPAESGTVTGEIIGLPMVAFDLI
jgi:2-keto-4-pentenoate hydratase